MSSKNSIQVCIKVRPLLPKERGAICLWHVKDNSIHLTDSHADPYYFDFIFDQNATNQNIFEKMAKNIVHACIQGFNGTIFAYGQTSSGKTYTMMGDEHNPGVMVLAAKEIFNQIEQNADRQYLLRVGYIEIYNEKIYDLLNKKNQDLKIQETVNGVVSVNCDECIITCENDLLHFLCLGNKERTVGGTNMNERSSRSHAIFRIIIESSKTDRTEEDAVIQSVLNLVDLAGSERADQTGARGARLKEGGHINKSLLFLSNVIKRLSENEDHKYISYRDSKLTRILQASLGGNALTSIICTIKPTAIEETQSTLNFAMRAKTVKNKPQLNEIVSDSTMMKRLEREIKDLKNHLAEERRKNESQPKVNQLEKRIKDYMLKIISCNSLINTRNAREKRRRTWCPTSSINNGTLKLQTDSTDHETQLPKPNFFPSHITKRDNVPKTVQIFNRHEVENVEDFKPAELFNFDAAFETPKPINKSEHSNIRKISVTPNIKELAAKSLESIERDYLELQNYTNLENQIEVKHEMYEALKIKLENVASERDRLENDRLNYIQIKHDWEESKQSLVNSQKRCEDLENKISHFTAANASANEKIQGYEEELLKLKERISEFEFKSTNVEQKTDLKSQLDEIHIRYNDLMQEYNDLSNQLIESIQENDMLREKCYKNQIDKAPPIIEPQYCNDIISIHDLLLKEILNDGNEDLITRFDDLTESLYEIELESIKGLKRIFKIKNTIECTSPARKLCINKIQEIESIENRCCDRKQKPCLQCFIKQYRIHVVELRKYEKDISNISNSDKVYNAHLENLLEKKNVAIEFAENAIRELQKEMTLLQSALLEKSIIYENTEDNPLENDSSKIECEVPNKVKECDINESINKSGYQINFNGILDLKKKDYKNEINKFNLNLSAKDESLIEMNNVKTNNDILENKEAEKGEQLEKHEGEIKELKSYPNQSIDLLKKEMDRLQEKYDENLKLLESLRSENSQYLEKNNNLTIENSALNRNLSNCQNEIKSLNSILADLQNIKSENYKLVSLIEEIKKNCASHISSLEDYKLLKSSNEDTLVELKQLRCELKMLQVKNETEKQTLSEKIETQTKELFDAQKKAEAYEKLVSDHENLQQTLKEQNSIKNNLVERIKILEDHLEEMEKREKLQKHQCQLVENLLTSAKEELLTAEKEKNTLKEQLTFISEKTIHTKHNEAVQAKSESSFDRLCTYNKKCRLSSFVKTCDIGIITDPFDLNCKCTELSLKLKDTERKLYINEGLVKNLRMDLKNHPLKEENALIKKRLLEEQEKARNELKKIKLKNHDLQYKLKLLQENSGDINKDLAMQVTNKNVCDGESQTELEINSLIQNIESKNKDLTNICRYRYKIIKDLEAKLAFNDNTDNSDITSVEKKQLNSLKIENNVLQQELNCIKEKYENAKIVLTKRRLEIEKLQKLLVPSLEKLEDK